MIRRWWIAVVLLASLRLAHINLLWADEDYHLAAAIQILKGRVPYRDFWYDKPPLAAFFYALIGGYPGWPLRLLDVVYLLACCWIAYKLAKAWWGENEGRAAALLLAFFTTFYLTSATVPLAVDGLLLLPHLAAVYCAFQGRPLYCGLCCAAGLLTNVKAVFVVATCALWLTSDLPLFAAGLALPLVVAGGVGAGLGVLPNFYQQVWGWGLVYAKSAASTDALRRSADWLAFHAALVAGVVMAGRELRYRFWVWFAMSGAALFLGSQLAPRYFFQVLPVLVIFASRGLVLGMERYGRMAVAVAVLLLIIPLVRFGPRYALLMRDNLRGERTTWPDAALDVDSQQVAEIINARKRPGDSLFVWGYRPDIYVYTRLMPDGKFVDSQALDGVPADRHLQTSKPSGQVGAARNRAEFVKSASTYLVDGLGVLNAGLRVGEFRDLEGWLGRYRLVGRTRFSLVYETKVGWGAGLGEGGAKFEERWRLAWRPGAPFRSRF